MMVFTRGLERTSAEDGELLTRAGLKPGRVQPVAAPYGIVEGLAP